ncbi:MAG: SpoIIE family protein phosphatase [Candidatus Aureabacteria bacterium]|nr:SpoIIE family protein phosphatase [Candidatus Auribacterota bacterium]
MDTDAAAIKDRIAELGALQDQLHLATHKITNLSALVEISKIINSTLDLDTLLNMIMEIIKQVLNAESGSLMLIDERGDELLYRVAIGEKGKQLKEKHRQKMGLGIAGWVATHGEPLLVPDVTKDKRFDPTADALLRQTTRSILCVPLQSQGKTIGVLEAINSRSAVGFSQDDLALFTAFASQAAVAIESARLHARLLEKQRIEQELEIAHQIQQNFLPSSFPKIPGVHCYAKTIPAWETGGDFFDVMDLGQGRIGAVVGDVSGKGVPAALYMVKALSEFRFRASYAMGVDKVLEALNRSLLEHNTSGMFVTLIYLIIDTAARTLSYGSAGHLPIMLKRATAAAVELLDSARCVPLGITPGAPYLMNTMPIEKGDLLFLYTDGIIEARNRKGQEFEMQRLRQLLSRNTAGPQATVRRVMARVAAFSKGTPQHDDLTAMAIRIG